LSRLPSGVERPWRPTKQQLEQARGKTVPDVIDTGLNVLFAGINPGLYTAAVGHHFARPGNRFWPALHASGFTGRTLSPFEEALLVERGLGITNLVARATAAAAELTRDELRAGARALERKVRRYRPKVLAPLGLTVYRTGWDHPKATVGLQKESIADTRIWLLPNTSGLNAHYQLENLAAMFAELREFVALEAAIERIPG
jgi:TDG/mug DNA glycosylase family protein